MRCRRRNGLLLIAALPVFAGCGNDRASDGLEPPEPVRGEKLSARDWPTYGGQASGTQYSSLDQINRDNVHDLRVAWAYRTGDVRERADGVDPTTFEVTPILADDKIVFCTPLSNVAALNPASGEPVWRFEFDKRSADKVNPVNNCRGVAYWESDAVHGDCRKRIFEATDTGILLAIDAATGKACPAFGDEGQVDLNELDNRGDGRIGMTSPPAIVNDVVVVGSVVRDNAVRDAPDGIVRGFDAISGGLLWEWNPIPAELSANVGGANTWAPISVDKARGWVFLPTSSPSYDAYGVNRSTPIVDANAVVALDASTGRKVWSYQVVRHDLWDYDLGAMPTLATITIDGRPVEAVIQATKMGLTFVLDRSSGEPLFPVDERAVPATDIVGEIAARTQPVPQLPPPVTRLKMTADDAWGAVYLDRRSCRKQVASLRNDGIYTPPSAQGSMLLPSFLRRHELGRRRVRRDDRHRRDELIRLRLGRAADCARGIRS